MISYVLVISVCKTLCNQLYACPYKMTKLNSDIKLLFFILFFYFYFFIFIFFQMNYHLSQRRFTQNSEESDWLSQSIFFFFKSLYMSKDNKHFCDYINKISKLFRTKKHLAVITVSIGMKRLVETVKTQIGCQRMSVSTLLATHPGTF